MTTFSVTQVRARLRAVLDLVKDGHEVVLTQNGEPVAVILHPTKLKARRDMPTWGAAAARLDRLREARHARPERGAGLDPERAEQLVAEVRRARDER
ncbi:MAG: type II toxin-antitoxin system Phd/YefM family antitoxin [Solirubrobacterales bacterium]